MHAVEEDGLHAPSGSIATPTYAGDMVVLQFIDSVFGVAFLLPLPVTPEN